MRKNIFIDEIILGIGIFFNKYIQIVLNTLFVKLRGFALPDENRKKKKNV
jgi:hypothetical protein